MVHFFVKPSLIPFLVVVVFYSFVASSDASKVVEISVICNRSTIADVTFCIGLLNSTRPGADLVTLAQYTTDVARSNVTNMISIVKKLLAESGSDPAKKQHYEECLSYYGGESGALSDVEKIQQGLKSGDYGGMVLSVQHLMENNEACVHGEDPPRPRPNAEAEPISLEDYGDILDDVAIVIATIARLLEEQ